MHKPPIQPGIASLIDAELDAALVSGAVLLTANQRQYRAFEATFNRHRLNEGSVAWNTPQILTFDAWVQSLFKDAVAVGLSSLELLSEPEELFLWKSIVDRTPSHALLSAGGTARSLATSWRVEHAWQHPDTPTDCFQNQDHQFYRSVSDRYRTKTAEQGLIDSARLLDALIPLMTDASLTLPTQIWFTGFIQLTVQQKNFIDALESAGVQIHSPYTPVVTTANVALAPLEDSSAELLASARWARRKLGENTGYIGVIIPELHIRRAEVERVFDAVFFPGASPAEIESSGRPYDISYGQTLDQHAVVESALLCLSLAFTRIEAREITRLLLSPHLAGSDSERLARSALDASLRQQGVRHLSAKSLHGRCRPELPLLEQCLDQMQDQAIRTKALPSEWLDRIVRVLDSMGWPGSGLSSSEFQAVEAWQAQLEQLGRFDGLAGEIDLRSALAVVREQTSARVFQPRTEDRRIQILGVLEGQGLRFDALWITGMDNESWPMRQPVSAFLSFDWQRKVGVPGADLELDLDRARLCVQQWTESSSEVVFSHVKLRDGNELSPTRQVASYPPIESTQIGIAGSIDAVESVANALQLEVLTDDAGPETVPGESVRGGARLFEDQAGCPFKAFATHRLAIKPLEEPVLGLDPREKGRVFHLAMENFWKEIRDHASLVALSPDELNARVESFVSEAIKPVAHESASLLLMEQKRITALIVEWLTAIESRRTPFEVIETEGNIELEFEQLNLRLQVDRIDSVDGAGKLIVDYKTGAGNSTASWKKERITSPQLPLYAINLEDVIGACFAQVVRGSQRFVGLAEDKSIAQGLQQSDEWAQQLEDWKERLSELATEIHQGVAIVTPSNSACAYCKLPRLCRIDAATVDEVRDGTGDDEAGDSSSRSEAGRSQ